MKRIRKANIGIYGVDRSKEELMWFRQKYQADFLYLMGSVRKLNEGIRELYIFYKDRNVDLEEMFELLKIPRSYKEYEELLERILQVMDDILSLYSKVNEDTDKVWVKL